MLNLYVNVDFNLTIQARNNHSNLFFKFYQPLTNFNKHVIITHMKDDQADFFTVNEFAEKLGVHPNSVRNMIKNGRLNAFRIGGGKTSSYRIPKSEIAIMASIDFSKYVDDIVEKKLREEKNKK